MDKRLFRPTGWNLLGLVLMLFALALAAFRFYKGLGAATNLSDTYGWGIWIAFDVMSGVALAAGGFIIAAAVYIFNLKQFKPFARPAVLTAFLGYFLVIVGLLVDLGLPWRIYHPLIMPQIHSAMLEVAMCVMFYFTVLFFEFLPAVFQKFKLKKAYHRIHAFTIPLVIAGIMLSCMHQSSLGSLLLLMKEQLNPLWYSPSLPFNFLLQAVALGLAVAMFESQMSSKMYKRPIENEGLTGLAKGCALVLLTYFIWRMIDITYQGHWGGLFISAYETFWFVVEYVVGVIIPFFILIGSARANPKPRLWAAILVISGTVLSKINYTLTGMGHGTGEFYFPTWQEIFISIGIVSAGLLVFQAAVQMLPVMEPEIEEAEAAMAAA